MRGSALVYVGHKSEEVLERGGAAGSVCSGHKKSRAFQYVKGYKSFSLEECDLVFSSPPFWKTEGFMLERNHQCETSYHRFMKKSLFPIMRKCLSAKRKRRTIQGSGSSRPSLWICLHLPDGGPMYSDLVKEFGECNLKLQFRARTSPARDDFIFCWNSKC